MLRMEFVEVSTEYGDAFRPVLDELRAGDELGFWHEVGSPETIEEYIRLRLDHAKGINLPAHWIPATTFWLLEEGTCIGELTIRHQLTDHLRNIGGQIGYWIRPSKRKQGYGKKILAHGLQMARGMGMEKVLITCDETNIGSRKIIESNGGVFERTQDMGPDLPKKLLFWIDL